MDYKKISGLHIREARQRNKWTLKELADRTKTLSVSRISNYEQGLRSVDVSTAAELAAALGVSVGYILGIENPLSQDESVLLEKYRNADQRGKDTIQSVAGTQSTPVGRKSNHS